MINVKVAFNYLEKYLLPSQNFNHKISKILKKIRNFLKDQVKFGLNNRIFTLPEIPTYKKKQSFS